MLVRWLTDARPLQYFARVFYRERWAMGALMLWHEIGFKALSCSSFLIIRDVINIIGLKVNALKRAWGAFSLMLDMSISPSALPGFAAWAWFWKNISQCNTWRHLQRTFLANALPCAYNECTRNLKESYSHWNQCRKHLLPMIRQTTGTISTVVWLHVNCYYLFFIEAHYKAQP